MYSVVVLVMGELAKASNIGTRNPGEWNWKILFRTYFPSDFPLVCEVNYLFTYLFEVESNVSAFVEQVFEEEECGTIVR